MVEPFSSHVYKRKPTYFSGGHSVPCQVYEVKRLDLIYKKKKNVTLLSI